MRTSRIPIVVPFGWRVISLDSGAAITRDLDNGLRGIFSIDPGPAWSDGEAGWWRHLSISRYRDAKYPTWDDQRDLVYRCGLFRPERSVFSVLPPKAEYVDVQSPKGNVFHWWQKDG